MSSYADMVNRGILPPGGNAAGMHVLYSEDLGVGVVDPERCDSYDLRWYAGGIYVAYVVIDGERWVLQFPDSSTTTPSRANEAQM